ncbi:hypothetical protein BHE74_00016832 [Ensete ventricosum]|nr:hypothetical protein BHE74_00016832 [Ensete ventricosum]
MYAHKPKNTDKYEHFIEHLVYTGKRDILPHLFLRRPRRSHCIVRISSHFAESSIFYFGYNTPLWLPTTLRRCC